MAGHLTSSISYAMTRALPSLSSSPRLTGSSEDSLNIVGILRQIITRKMRKHSFIQLIENRFTGSKMLSTLSIVIHIGDLALDYAHYKYTKIHSTKRMLDTASQTGIVMVPSTE
jgi:hypothetical protein